MLDLAQTPQSVEFEGGRVFGHEEERLSIAQRFHDQASSPLLAAILAVENARQKLKEKGLPEAEEVARASEFLSNSWTTFRKS